nr:hypothetical protein B0A51_01161 [Rachicladosporium sp. CCFEE 5018]
MAIAASVQTCLRQPALTRVCRQLREELLPVFYSIHHFHIELDQLRNSSNKPRRTFNNSIDGWIRGIGDTNLRYMRRFTMAAPRGRIPHCQFETLQLSYARCDGRVIGEVAITRVDFGLAPMPAEPEKTYWKYDNGLSRWPFLVALMDSGLHVRALECMIASLGGVLQDYSALEVQTQSEEDVSDYTELFKLRSRNVWFSAIQR